ncbi:MAG: DUF1302 domain-containing protein [Burkholderiales bacterium]|nr:DUF1302 domain-containing protein [Burkholderiales bacterium]
MHKNTMPSTRHRVAAACLVAVAAGPASALDFEVGDGWQGVWNTSISVSNAWRAGNQNPLLFSKADGAIVGKVGGMGGSNTDSSNLNYNKGDTISRLLKFTSDVSLAKNGSGGLLRVRGWYDDVLVNSLPRFGNQAQRPVRYTNTQPLSDTGVPLASRFQGLQLMDAYAYTQFDLASHPLQVRLGNQVINWGESLFTQGINKTMPVDLIAATRGAGTEVKEFLLPIPMLSANLGLGGGVSLEGFYQFKSVSTVIPGCGTYFGPAENDLSNQTGNCNIATAVAGSNVSASAGGLYMPLANGPKPANGGQFGLALRVPVEAIDTEFGFYAEELVPRTPIISATVGTDQLNGTAKQVAILKSQGLFMAVQALAPLGLTPGSAFWEYPGKTKIFGISASTTLLGWSTGAELSYQKDVPAQINGSDLVGAFIGHAGLVTQDPRYTAVIGTVGGVYHAYDLFNVTQLQANAVKLFSGVLGADSLTIAAEVAMQQNNVPSHTAGGLRYGRAFIFGQGANAALPAAAQPNGCLTTNVQPDGCRNDGYVTKNASGINVLASMTYNGIFGSSFAFTPSLFVKRDLSGYSIDSQFIKDRTTYALAAKFDYAKKWAFDLSYITYNNSAKYDANRDKGFVSVAWTGKF